MPSMDDLRAAITSAPMVATLIAVNLAVFIIGLFGSQFERFAGSAHLLGVYVFAGLAGSLALAAPVVAPHPGRAGTSRGSSIRATSSLCSSV